MDVSQTREKVLAAARARRQYRTDLAKAKSGMPLDERNEADEPPDKPEQKSEQLAAEIPKKNKIEENPEEEDSELVKQEEKSLVAGGDTVNPPASKYTASLQTERNYEGNFAQRNCEDLGARLAVAEKANLRLHDKILKLEESQNMLMDQVNEVQTENGRLDTTLLDQERLCKSLTSKNEKIISSLSQRKRELEAQERENASLIQRLRDLEEAQKRLQKENYELQENHGPCQMELAQLREQNAEYYRKGTAFLHQRDQLKKDVQVLTAANDTLILERENYKRRMQEAQEARAALEVSEGKFREAARTWKTRYTGINQENEGLVKTCSKLVEENSTLRHENSIVDDSALRTSLSSLNYSIRDWCDQVVEAKPAGASGFFSKFPLDPKGDGFMTELGDDELNPLIACIWEWVIKLVLSCEELPDGRENFPDLWTDDETRLCLNNIENRLMEKDHAAAARWRYRTVQQLSQVGLCNGDHRAEKVVDAILGWVVKCFDLVEHSESVEKLRRALRDQVVKEAIAFALDLRRQDNFVSINISRSVGQALRCVPVLLGVRPLRPDDTILKLCITPQLKRYNPGTAKRKACEDIIVEAVFTSLRMKPWNPKSVRSVGPCRQAQDEVEVDTEID